jgi:hypothetical protein
MNPQYEFQKQKNEGSLHIHPKISTILVGGVAGILSVGITQSIPQLLSLF